MTVSEFTSEQLQVELDERERVAEEEREKYKHPPEPLDNPDWSGLLEACKSYIDSIAHVTLGVEARAAHYDIFMAAIQAVFGKEIYGERVEYWIRKKTPPWKIRRML